MDVPGSASSRWHGVFPAGKPHSFNGDHRCSRHGAAKAPEAAPLGFNVPYWKWPSIIPAHVHLLNIHTGVRQSPLSAAAIKRVVPNGCYQYGSATTFIDTAGLGYQENTGLTGSVSHKEVNCGDLQNNYWNPAYTASISGLIPRPGGSGKPVIRGSAPPIALDRKKEYHRVTGKKQWGWRYYF